MRILTEKSILKCDHGGMVPVGRTRQSFVHIDGATVAVGDDPKGGPFVAPPCPMTSPKPCSQRMRFVNGNSRLVFIDGRPVCIDTLKGATDFPASYSVLTANQDFVKVSQ